MEEWVTAHESLNSMQVNASKDTQNSVKQKPSFEHGDSPTNPSTSPSAPSSSSSSLYYSARTENMIENKNKFSSELEFNIEYSKAHWSQLADTDDDEDITEYSDDDGDTEYSAEANLEHFERLKAHNGWGEFFKDFQSLVVGEKIAEGAQAEIYEATLSGLYRCVVKVFKEGYALRDLQRQWPEGMLKSYNEMTLPHSRFETLQRYDGREPGHFDYGENSLYYSESSIHALEPMKDKGGPLECILGATLLKDERFKNRFAFVMKRQWGDLRKLIDAQMLKNNSHGPPFSRRSSRNLMCNIAWDMRNLHQKYGIIHRDLKASNVLLRYVPKDVELSDAMLEETNASLLEHHSLLMKVDASLMEHHALLLEHHSLLMKVDASLMEHRALLMENHSLWEDLNASIVRIQSLSKDLELSHDMLEVLNDTLKELIALPMELYSSSVDLSHSIVHPRGTLVYSKNNPTTVADFECSLGVVGTAFWRAPEILQQLKNGIPTSKIRFSYEADVYSYGMTCYEIATGRIPFEGHPTTNYSVVLNGERPELPHDLGPSVRKVITDCWHQDPSQRPYFSDIVDALSKNEGIE